jgi:hypothetical protein
MPPKDMVLTDSRTPGNNENFCWNFQFCAMILFFVKGIRDYKSIVSEGAHEDFEITKEDSSIIYCQCKAFNNPSSPSKVWDQFKNAISSLSKVPIKHLAELYYVTNSDIPFGNRSNAFLTREPIVKYSFKELPPKDLAKIFVEVGKDPEFLQIDKDRFSIAKIPFNLAIDPDTEYRSLFAAIRTFLSGLGSGLDGKQEEVFNFWMSLVHHNSELSYRFECRKSDFVWPVIAIACAQKLPEDIGLVCMDGSDEEFIRQEYAKVIGYHMNRYQLFQSVIFKYRCEKDRAALKNIKISSLSFANQFGSFFEKDISSEGIPESVYKNLVRIIVMVIVDIKYTFSEIKERTGMDGDNLD